MTLTTIAPLLVKCGHHWSLGGILFLLIGGAVIGILGKMVAPGDRDRIPFWLTVLCGIVGIFVGNWLYVDVLGGRCATSGIDFPPCMMSRMNLSSAPSRPPGCSMPKSTAVKPRLSSSAIASASPSASCMSEDVVGARLCGQASRACGSTSVTSAAAPSVLAPSAVTATRPILTG